MIAEQANELTHDAAEWIEHKAGPCPVDKRALVKVQMRFELTLGRDESQMAKRAGSWGDHWTHSGEPQYDIVAWRHAGAA